jgi:hypothetical protein
MSEKAAVPERTGYVDGLPHVFLRIESGAVAAGAITAFAFDGQSWWLFAALILVPDLSMLGYLAGNRIGAYFYNAAHIYVGPLLLGAAAGLASSSFWTAVAFIWAAHIGIDRALGFGLKHAHSFRSTHLGPVGARSPS